MKKLTHFPRHLQIFVSLMLALIAHSSRADAIVWSCSRSEPKQTTFEGIKAFRIENLTTKDTDTISITLLDLYGAYGGEVIQMGKTISLFAACHPKTLSKSQPWNCSDTRRKSFSKCPNHPRGL